MPVKPVTVPYCAIPMSEQSTMNGKRPPRHFEPKEFQSEHINDWCAGCGDHGILRALEQALSDSGLSPDEVAVFGGIGCSGKTPYYMNTYGIHTLHGRLLPFAAGAKLARPALTVIAAGGDGDGLSIGAGHFVNAGRRNLDLTYVFFNNGVYGLTKGQASPTLGRGEQTRSMPLRSIQEPLNPVLLAFAAGYTWIGRGYAYDVKGLAGLIRQAIAHPGIAFLDVLQPCPRYNDIHTRQWYAGRLYSLEKAGHDARITAEDSEERAGRVRATGLSRALEWGERIPTGIFLEDLSAPPFLELVTQLQPAYGDSPPAELPVADAGGRPLAKLDELFSEFAV